MRFLYWTSIPSAAASLKEPRVLANGVDPICLLRGV